MTMQKPITEKYMIKILEELVLIGRIKNPDKFIINLIKEIYGHKVKLNDLVQLIESSPLRKS